MSEEKKYYCFCSSNCKYETLNKEQILTTIQQALEGQQIIDPDGGVITKVKELNKGGYVTFWVGSRAEYNALGENAPKNCICIMNDDTSADDLNKKLKALEEKIDAAAASVPSSASKLDDTLKYSSGGTGINEVEVQFTHYTLLPTKKPSFDMVFYTAFIYIKGKLTAGEELFFEHIGNHFPYTGNCFNNPCYAQLSCPIENHILQGWGNNLVADYRREGIKIKVLEDYTFTLGTLLQLQGFYYLDMDYNSNFI